MITLDLTLPTNNFDYIIDKQDKFLNLLPHLYPKILGDWKIALIDPKLEFIRQLLDTDMVQEYVDVHVVTTKDFVEKLSVERPQLRLDDKSMWDCFQEMIANLPILIDKKAISAIYNSVPKVKTELQQVLDKLVETCLDKGKIEYKDVKNLVVIHRPYFANQIFKAFALLDNNRWYKLNIFILDLGEKRAYYTLRKYVRKLVVEKAAYLSNKEYKDKNVENIDGYTLAYAHMLFQQSTHYKQLSTILLYLERRQLNVDM